MNLLRFVLACIVAFCVAPGVLGCKKKEEAPATVPTHLAPPDSMLCEGSVHAPDSTWKHVQQGVAGLATLLPSSAFGVLAVSGGLEVGLGDLVDGSRPVSFVVAGNVLAPQWVLVASARDRRAVEAKFPSRGATRLVAPSTISLERLPVQGTLTGIGLGGAETAAFTVYLSSRGDLVVARDEASADLLAPYALFTLQPEAAKPQTEPHDVVVRVPETAMPALANVLRLKWTQIQLKLVEQDAADRKAHGGRAPDFGEPAALVAAANAFIGSMTNYLGDASDVTFVFDATKQGTTLEVQVPSKGGAWTTLLQGLSEGSGEPLAAEPMSTRVAWLGYGTPAGRTETAKSIAKVLGDTLDGRISTASKDALERSLVAFGVNAGSSTRIRLESDPLRVTLLATPPESSADAYRQAMTDTLGVFKRESKLRELLRLSKVEGPVKMKQGQGNTDTAPPLRTLLTTTDSTLALYAREKSAVLAYSLERAPKLDLLSDLPGDAPWLQAVRPELARMLRDLGPRSVFLMLSGLALAKTAEEPSVLVVGIGKRDAAGTNVLSMRMLAPYRFARELPRLAIPDLLSP